MFFSNKFVSATRGYNTIKKHVNAPYLRRSFVLETIPKSACVTLTALGFYELYLNGKRLTRGALSPYITNPDQVLYYDTYDVTQLLCVGENVFGFILGNGMQNTDIRPWDFYKAAFRSSPKLAFALELDGKLAFEADESFVCAPSPITFDDLRCGERYDARLEIENWNTADFDDKDWQKAFAVSTPKGRKLLSTCPPIKPYAERKAVKITKVFGGYVYDFGVNSAGLLRFDFEGKRNRKIEVVHGEVLVRGRVSQSNISCSSRTPRKYNQREVYICKGGQESYVPFFTYNGFRYAYVKGLTATQATADAFTYLEMSSELKEIGGIECSEERVNELQKLVRRSTLANFFHFPTDCPHREKNGWTGDAAMSAEHTLLNLDAKEAYRNWLYSVRGAQREDGNLPGIVPTGGWGFDWGNGAPWDEVIAMLPFMIYKYYGDLSVFRENADAIRKYLGFIRGKLRKDGTVEYGLGDWCQTEAANHRIPDVPLSVTSTLICMDYCRMSAVLFRAIKDDAACAEAEELFGVLKNGFRTALINRETQAVKGESQSGQAMAIFYGAFEESEKSTAYAVLKEYVKRDGNHFNVGVLGARVLFRVLSEFGDSALAYKLIMQPEYPSYAHWLTQGATALRESFSNLKSVANLSSKREIGLLRGSLNHHFWGDVSAWFIMVLGGINVNPKEDDCTEIVIKPYFAPELSYCRAWHEMPYGKIETLWRRTDKGVTLTVTLPEGAHARYVGASEEIPLKAGENVIEL